MLLETHFKCGQGFSVLNIDNHNVLMSKRWLQVSLKTAVTVNNIIFTVIHISNSNNVLASGFSFIAVMATRGHIITYFGGGSRDDATIAFGSGKDHQLCICSCT